MELKTGNEQLRRINDKINVLVEDIRTELLARDDQSKELNYATIKSLLKYIANPLKNMSIDGNEMMLEDMINLYDEVIKKLDEVAKTKQYSDSQKLDASEVKAFEQARDILKKDKDQGKGHINDIYKQILKEHVKGKLEEGYINSEIAKDQRIGKIKKDIKSTEDELNSGIDSIKKLEELSQKLNPEISFVNNIQQTDEVLGKFDEQLDKIEKALSTGKISEEQQKKLEQLKSIALQKKANKIKSVDSEFNKEEYKKRDDEELSEYVKRLEEKYEEKRENIRKSLNKKISSELHYEFSIFNINKNKLQTIDVRDRYLPKFNGNNVDLNWKGILYLKKSIGHDLEDNNTYILALNEKKLELEMKQIEIEDEIREELSNSSNDEKENPSEGLVVPIYNEKQSGVELSNAAKWRQRMAFRFRHPSKLFNGKEKVEFAMYEEKKKSIMQNMTDTTSNQEKKNTPRAIDSEEVLKDLEEQSKKFKNKYVIKSKVKENIYSKWNKEGKMRQEEQGER